MSGPRAAVRSAADAPSAYDHRGASAVHRRPVRMPTPADTARNWVAATLAGESREHLVTPDFRFVGQVFAGLILELDGERSPDVAARRMAEAGIRLTFREVEDAGPGRAWVEVVWTHDAGRGHGSAGLQWVVFTVEGERMAEVHFFQDREAARAYALAGAAG